MNEKRHGSGQTALVTGASMGIGVDLAECFAADGYDLILTARSESALQALAERLAKEHRVKAIAIAVDLGERGAGSRLIEEIGRRGMVVDVLVNNAGYGIAGAFAGSKLEDQLGIIDVNDRALVELTHHTWPGMLERRRGGLLNVASTAAFQPGPLMSVYYASKAFVLSFSEALWREAAGTGVHVSCLCPGPTTSNFRARAGTGATRLSKRPKMSALEVARLGYAGFQANERVVITGFTNALAARLVPLLPRGAVLNSVYALQSPSE
jgi:short-subunit dehydrogenase